MLSNLTLNLPSNVVGDSNDKANFPHTFLLTHAQGPRIRNAFANGSSTHIEFSKTRLSKMVQLG